MAVVDHETAVVKPRARPVAIDRASGDDVMSLVSDRHDPPMQVGAVLLLDVGDDLDAAQLTEVLKRRLTSVPRLRQNLIHVPVGCGRPVWVDYPGFEFTEHFAVVRWPEAITEQSLLDFAAAQLTTRLPRDRPLWAATLLIGEGDGRAALVLVFHHVLADGIAGLAVLGRLVDGVPSVDAADFPRPAPSLIRLALDSAASRVRSVRRVPVMVRRLTSAVIELGPSLRTKASPVLAQPADRDAPPGAYGAIGPDPGHSPRPPERSDGERCDPLRDHRGAAPASRRARGTHAGVRGLDPGLLSAAGRPRRAGQPEWCRSGAPARNRYLPGSPRVDSPRSPGPPRVINAGHPRRC